MSDPHPSERELDILKVLWELGECKVRDVHAALDAQKKTAFTTVQTILRIMADKGLVTQRAVGRSLHYAAKCTQEQVGSRFLQRVYDGAMDRMVLHLLETEQVPPEEMRELEKLIARVRKAKTESRE